MRVQRQFSYSYPACCRENLFRFRTGITNHNAFVGKTGSIHERSPPGVRRNRKVLVLSHPILGQSDHSEGETLFATTFNNLCLPGVLQDLMNIHYYSSMSFKIIISHHISLGIIWRNETTWQIYIFELFNVYLRNIFRSCSLRNTVPVLMGLLTESQVA